MTPSKIILHCSATVDGQTFSWDDIRRYHIEDKGWRDIGYHYGLETVDNWFCLMQGRPPEEEGSHCKAAGRNHDSVGFCVVGNYDEEGPDPIRYRLVVRALSALCWALKISPREVYGHREFEDSKTCPGLKWDLDKVRRDVLYNFQTREGEGIMRAAGVFL